MINKRFILPIIIQAWLIVAGINISKGQVSFDKSFDIRTESSRPKILKLFTDKKGLIWVGTDQGVFTFDGIYFTKIDLKDTISASVSAIYEDKEECVWIGFSNGNIFRIKDFNAFPFNLAEGTPKVPVSAFAEDSTGRFYYSTKGEGIYCLENGKIAQIDHEDGMSDDYCYSMVLLPDQRICVGTDGGLNFLQYSGGRKKVSVLGPSEGLPDDIARTFAFGLDNLLWIGLQDKGIVSYDYKNNKLIPFNNKTKWDYGQVNSILAVDSELWIATEENGIIETNRQGESRKLKLKDIENVKVSDMILDLENNVWISESIHLIRTTGNKIKILQTLGDKKFKFIHCITSDKNGNIWFSPDQQLGCIYFSKGIWKYKEYKIFNDLIDISSLYFDSYGYLWIGTMGEGVFRFNPANGQIRKIGTENSTEKPSILSIKGSDDVVWVCGFNSVVKYKIEKNGLLGNAEIKNEKIFTESKLMDDYVYSVFIDSKKRTWFGTDENGIFVLENGSLRNVYQSTHAIHSFTEDKKRRIWFSVAESGLKYFDLNDSVYSFQAEDGLSDPSSTSIACVSNGNIIIVHENGFDVLNPETKTIFYHSTEEGLSDMNPDLNSITTSPDGTLWIGSEYGILIYNPLFDTKLNRPKVFLESVSVYLNKIDFRNKNNFSSDENNIRFDFNGVWYSDPQKLKYYFILEGYSNKWEATKDQYITFPQLTPGTYTFRLKASLNSRYSDSNETTYRFVINPPYWQTWWFRILTAGLIVIIIFSIIRRRENRLRNFERLEKEKIEFQFETLRSQVNPHFLFNSFNTLINVIETSPSLAVEYVERLSDFFRSIITYRDKNLIRIEEELKLLENFIFIQKKRYGNNLVLKISLEEKLTKSKYVPPLSLQLLAENAIKHNAISKDTPLTIEISSNEKELIISNNINTKLTKEKSTGIGLQNIIKRYEILTTENVKVINDQKMFIVTIPILDSQNENINSRR